jgi:hypothetical protein
MPRSAAAAVFALSSTSNGPATGSGGRRCCPATPKISIGTTSPSNSA